MFTLLMTGFASTRPAKGQDPEIRYVLPGQVAQKFDQHDIELQRLRDDQNSLRTRMDAYHQSQTEVNKAILAELKALRTEKKVEKPAVTVKAPPVQQSAAVLTHSGVRAAVGHTHTDSKGHTWDHQLDGGSHRCPACGEFQNRIDPPGRVVNVTPSYSYVNPNPPVVQAAVSQPAFAQQFAPLTFSTGGCANGGCSSAGTSYSTGRSGWYPGKLLGR